MELNIIFEIRYNKSEIFQNVINSKDLNFNANSVRNEKYFDINDVWDAVDSLFDLGDSNIFSFLKLSEEEQKKFWEIVSKLIKAGILGYRYYEVNGKLERHFIEYEIANPRLANARIKYIDKRQYSREWLV
ncbi:MAG: hypothetical protein N2560_09660 [Ignavibacteria bacterium]|nr:hypothetical protein [Ignavibacteria bacterium]